MSKFSFSSSKIRNTCLLALILVIVFFAFSPALENGFVFWDDDVHLYQNTTIRTLDVEHVGEIFTDVVNEIYIPLTSLSFAVEHHFFGRAPFVYHLDNLLLHLAVVALIFWLGCRLGLSALASGIAALLFGIHPLHVESVAWITERKDVLYSFFYMAALLSYCRYLNFTKSTPSIQNKKLTRYLVLTVLFGILSMLAKPMALSLPLILFLLDWFHGRKIDRDAIIEKTPLALGIIGIAWVTYSAHARIPGEGGAIEGALIWAWTCVFYLRQFVFPFMLIPIYQLPKPITFLNPEYLISVIVVFTVIFAVIRLRRHRWFIFSFAFYIFSIFFLLRFDELLDTSVVADRFMYLPSLGFCFLFGYGFQRALACRKRQILIPVVVIFIVIVSFFSIRTRQQCRIWYDSVSLWHHQLQYYPSQPIALNNLAAILREKDEYKAAEEIYRRARRVHMEGSPVNFSDETIHSIEKVNYVIGLYGRAIASKPNYTNAYHHLGLLLKDIERFPEAVLAYHEALKLDPKHKNVHFSLGVLYQETGDYEKAIYAYDQTILFNSENEGVYVEIISAYNEAIEEDPKNTLFRQARGKTLDKFTHLIGNKPPNPESFFNLGTLYGGMGDYSRAISAYQMVLDINPNHSNAIFKLGNIYKDQGRLSEALSMYHRAVNADSRNSDAYLNIGSIYERQGKQGEARENFEAAVKVGSWNSRAYFNLGYIEERDGNHQKAVNYYQKSIEIDKNYKEVHYNLGNVYARLRKNSLAISSYLKAVDIDRNYKDAWINLSTLSFKEGDFSNAVKYYEEAALLGYKAPQGYLNVLERYREK